MEVGRACTSGTWTDDPLYWSEQIRAGRRLSVRTPAIYKSSVGLWPTLPRQVNTTSEDSSSISSFSCHPVFSSPSQFPTAMGDIPIPHHSSVPPQAMWKTRVCTSKLMKKRDEKSHLGRFRSHRMPSPCPSRHHCSQRLSVCAPVHIFESPTVAISCWSCRGCIWS